MNASPDITIAAEDPTSADATALMEQLNRELLARYPDSSVHGLDPAKLSASGGVFLIARRGGQPVGCGALRPDATGLAEIKRMFVLPAFRGKGVSRKLLDALEAEARKRGFTTLRLETGYGQPEAIGLYLTAGFTRIAAFGEYVGVPHSVCFEKRLD